MVESYEMCDFRLSEQNKHVARVSWTTVDASQLFGKQTRDRDRRTDLPHNDRRTFEFRDVLQYLGKYRFFV
jgi:hypothetical protein